MTEDINNILMSGCRMDWPEMTQAHNPDVWIVQCNGQQSA